MRSVSLFGHSSQVQDQQKRLEQQLKCVEKYKILQTAYVSALEKADTTKALQQLQQAAPNFNTLPECRGVDLDVYVSTQRKP